MELKDIVALVAGGSGGPGSEICRRLAANGANIAVGFRIGKDRAEPKATASVRDVANQVFCFCRRTAATVQTAVVDGGIQFA